MAKHVNISMNVFAIVNVTTMQYRMCYASIPMNEFVIANVATMQRRRYYTNIPMNTSITTNVLISQLGTSCASNSPTLANGMSLRGE